MVVSEAAYPGSIPGGRTRGVGERLLMTLLIRSFLAATLALSIGCTTRPVSDSKKGTDVSNASDGQDLSRYEIATADLPKFDRKVVRQLSRRLPLGDLESSRLELTLGERWAQTGQKLRSESRYRVLDERGQLRAAAESTLAVEDLSSDSSEIVVVSDQKTSSMH